MQISSSALLAELTMYCSYFILFWFDLNTTTHIILFLCHRTVYSYQVSSTQRSSGSHYIIWSLNNSQRCRVAIANSFEIYSNPQFTYFELAIIIQFSKSKFLIHIPKNIYTLKLVDNIFNPKLKFSWRIL